MNENIKTISKLLSDFNNFIDNRSIVLLMWRDGTFSKILEWHFKIWKKKYTYLNKKDKSDEWVIYSEISRTLDSLLQKIEKRALQEGQSFAFFETFKKHVEKYKREFILSEDKSRKYYYIESLFSIFYRVFFENIGSFPESDEIWENFPKEWKITTNNLTSKENIISQISLYKFLNWAQERIWQAKDFDRVLDDVSSNLFPEVEPVLWARILIFVLSPYDENRIKSVVERPWNFGFLSRNSLSYVIEDGEEIPGKEMDKMNNAFKEQVARTYELTYLLFRNEFSEENLKQYLNNLKEIKYPEGSQQEAKRLKLLKIFEGLLKYKTGNSC